MGSFANEKVLKDMEPVFRRVLGNDGLELKPELTANDVKGWDSMKHIELLVAIEDHFKIRLDMMAVATLANVGDLANLVSETVN